MVELREIERVAQLIGEAVQAERVILFGSYARGTAAEGSDVDLLVVASSKLPRFKRSRELYKLTSPHRFPMDLIVYTPEEIARGRKSAVSFISTVLKEGKPVYVRGNPDRRAVGIESQK